jgi:Cu/Ag efflux protein CusF
MKLKPLVIAAALMSLMSAPAFAQSTTDRAIKTSPGHFTVTRTESATGTVTEVDAAKGHISIKGPQGKVVPLQVNSEVRNLDKVKVGDNLNVRFEETLSLTLKKESTGTRSLEQSGREAKSTAAAGQRPAGVASEKDVIMADVTQVNTKKKTITLKGPYETVVLPVKDPNQLKLIKVGDQVEVIHTRNVAVAITAAK